MPGFIKKNKVKWPLFQNLISIDIKQTAKVHNEEL